MKFLNASNVRSFSLNILQMNGLELLEAARRVGDPDQGLQLMSVANREAGQQAHRELSRHVHNFAASAKTLVDHTRVFLEAEYATTPIFKAIGQKIKDSFVGNPVVAFVHDLRNYMVHKGLPKSHMFLEVKQKSPEDPEQVMTTGIRFITDSLAEWSSWTAPAKRYLEQSGEHIQIQKFAEEYLEAINRFHEWLEQTLHSHHAGELEELNSLQALARAQAAESEKRQEPEKMSDAPIPDASQPEPYTLRSDDAMVVDELSNAWAYRIRRIVLPQDKPEASFPYQRPVKTTLNLDEAIDTPTFTTEDVDGQMVRIFIRKDRDLFGLSLEDWSAVELVQNKLFEVPWVRNRVSQSFIEETLAKWARDRHADPGAPAFSERFIEKCRSAVEVHHVWFPIAHMEIQAPLKFGEIGIFPFDEKAVQEMESSVNTKRPEDAKLLFDEIREKFLGYAAIKLQVEAEPAMATERASVLARDAVNLLRFFAPFAASAAAICPMALSGFDLVPTSHILTSSEGKFSYAASINKNVTFWRLSSEAMLQLKENGLLQAGSLLDPTHLSEFSMAIRSSLITFSSGCTQVDRIERLGITLRALEGVLLRHEVEPVEASISDRLALLVASEEVSYAHIATLVRKAYHLATMRWTRNPSPREMEVAGELVFYAHRALRIGLANAAKFRTRAEFIAVLDGRREVVQAT